MWKNSPKLTKRHPKKFGTLVTVFISSDYPMFAKICPTMFSVWGSRKKISKKNSPAEMTFLVNSVTFGLKYADFGLKIPFLV